MKAKVAFISLFVLPICLFAQFTEYNTLFFGQYSDSPQAEIRQNGIGNFGFDSENSVFNPKYKDTKLILSISSLIETKSSTIADDSELFKSDPSIVPNFYIGYKFNSYHFQVSHFYSKYINPNALSGWASVFNINLGYLQYKLTNQILQFSIAKQLNDNLSLSTGILTNNFKYTLTGSEYDDSFDLETHFFNQFQFLCSLNFKSFSNKNVYILIKSQKSLIKLSPNDFKEVIYNDEPITNNTRVSYPGLVAIGYQFTLTTKLKLSIESLNHFLISNKKLSFTSVSGIEEEIMCKHNNWNPEFVLGLNYSKIKNFQFGIQYSRYWKFSNETNESDGIFQSEYKINSPQALILSTLFGFNDSMDISAVYQFSYAKTDYDYGGENNGYYRDLSHFLKLGLNVSIF